MRATSTIRRIALGAGVLAGGVALGWASTLAMQRGFGQQTITIGPWQTSLSTGGTDADMYTRAMVARTGLLALNRSETTYFTATHDAAGQPLQARCRYEVVGKPLSARWWSLTVYADDLFLLPDPNKRYSVNMKDATPGPDGTFRVLLGPERQSGLWLPTGAAGGFNLLLRLYNPSADVARDPAMARVPHITKMGDCR